MSIKEMQRDLWREMGSLLQGMESKNEETRRELSRELEQKEPVTISFKRPYRSTHSEA